LLRNNALNSDVCQEETKSKVSNIPLTRCSTFPIPTEAVSLEEKEENEFLNLRYKEQVSKEIMEKIRETKLRDQNLSLDNTLSGPSYDDQNLKSSTISQPISVTASGNISDFSKQLPIKQNINSQAQSVIPPEIHTTIETTQLEPSPIDQVQSTITSEIKIPYNQKVEQGLMGSYLVIVRRISLYETWICKFLIFL